jgi:hypothetical protein
MSFTGMLHDIHVPSSTAVLHEGTLPFYKGQGWISSLDVTDAVREYAARAHVASRLEGIFKFHSLEYCTTHSHPTQENQACRRIPFRLSVLPDDPPIDWLDIWSIVGNDGNDSGLSGASTDGSSRLQCDTSSQNDEGENIYGLYQRMLSGFFDNLRRKHEKILVYELPQGCREHWNLRFVSSELLPANNDLAGFFCPMTLAQRRVLGRAFHVHKPCKVKVLWHIAHAPKILYCVPLSDSREHEQTKVWWICFVQDIQEEDLWPSNEFDFGGNINHQWL